MLTLHGTTHRASAATFDDHLPCSREMSMFEAIASASVLNVTFALRD